MPELHVVHRQPVSLRDLDAFGHVNNAVYLTYVENARATFLREVVGARTVAEIRNIMAAATLALRAPATYGDELTVTVTVARLGTKSFELAYVVHAADDRLVAEATTVHVMFDFEHDRSVEIPGDWRTAMSAYVSAPAES